MGGKPGSDSRFPDVGSVIDDVRDAMTDHIGELPDIMDIFRRTPMKNATLMTSGQVR
jgi:hypothetical protein